MDAPPTPSTRPAPLRDVRIRSWLRATDHVRIARRFLAALVAFALAGGLAALLLRLELLSPGTDFMGASAFAMLFTTHGILMFHFVLAPSFLCVLGLALVPDQIGARGMAFPRLSRASVSLFVTGGALVLLAALLGGAPVGWMLDGPLDDQSSAVRMVLAATGVAFAAITLIMTAINHVTTIHVMRRRDLTWRSLPVFTWSILLASLCVIVTSPLLVTATGWVVSELFLKTDPFGPGAGADPLFYRKLFWLYGTPALYAIALPALGIVGDTISRRDRSPDLFAKALLAAVVAASFLLWGQHFPAAGAWSWTGILAGLATCVVVVLFLALALHFGRRLAAEGLRGGAGDAYMAASMGMLVAGVLSGLILGAPLLSRHLHNTTFMTAHVHFMTAGALLLAFLGGLHQSWPVLANRDATRPGLARAGLVVLVLGLFAAFGPLFLMGLGGALRRAHGYAPEFQVLQVFATAGTSVLLTGALLALLAFVPARRAA
jgi:cytochrome c oxidase subunit 1